uniref:DNA-directed RNA polymerase III subunit RPC8 isoform X1 n=1 Tax=Ictidomys tridecemlineatus TaxID=43179 RepID=UPI001A9E37F9|nr:DNA-directed RNA polymerase III subunit RPC8 isoform X1 [Ictidomys tridecemlineatus]
MFVLVEMVDTVRIPPWQFERKLNDSIAEELNKKLANKVVYNVGLCICLFDITKLEDAYVFPGDGASHTKVHFRYVVFHPFLDEILIGKIKGCSPEGVHVSLGFFDDILIPPESLQQPAKLYPSKGPALRRPPLPVRSCQRRRLHTHLWDPSVSLAWAFSHGGPATRSGVRRGTCPSSRPYLSPGEGGAAGPEQMLRSPCHPGPEGAGVSTAASMSSLPSDLVLIFPTERYP